jgi:hypothetical protein
LTQDFDHDEITDVILAAITKCIGGNDPTQPVLGSQAPVILDGLVGATVAVIAVTVTPEHWRKVAAEFSGRLAMAIENKLKADQERRQAH